jgi:hypothetical protein
MAIRPNGSLIRLYLDNTCPRRITGFAEFTDASHPDGIFRPTISLPGDFWPDVRGCAIEILGPGYSLELGEVVPVQVTRERAMAELHDAAYWTGYNGDITLGLPAPAGRDPLPITYPYAEWYPVTMPDLGERLAIDGLVTGKGLPPLPRTMPVPVLRIVLEQPERAKARIVEGTPWQTFEDEPMRVPSGFLLEYVNASSALAFAEQQGVPVTQVTVVTMSPEERLKAMRKMQAEGGAVHSDHGEVVLP